MRIEPPSPYEINNKYLETEVYVNQQKEKWKTWVHNDVRWMDRAHEIKYN